MVTSTMNVCLKYDIEIHDITGLGPMPAIVELWGYDGQNCSLSSSSRSTPITQKGTKYYASITMCRITHMHILPHCHACSQCQKKHLTQKLCLGSDKVSPVITFLSPHTFSTDEGLLTHQKCV